MNHVMLDIETLGDSSSSVITSIGAVQFDIETSKTNKTFHEYIKAESCVEHGLGMSVSTIMWWLDQSEEARATLTHGDKNGIHLVKALDRFSTWLKTMSADISRIYIWGRGPRFDMGILADAYRATSLPIPWNTRKELCVRTMEFLHPEVKAETKLVDTGHGSDGMGKHDAILDCLYQIAYVCNCYKKSKNI